MRKESGDGKSVGWNVRWGKENSVEGCLAANRRPALTVSSELTARISLSSSQSRLMMAFDESNPKQVGYYRTADHNYQPQRGVNEESLSKATRSFD